MSFEGEQVQVPAQTNQQGLGELHQAGSPAGSPSRGTDRAGAGAGVPRWRPGGQDSSIPSGNCQRSTDVIQQASSLVHQAQKEYAEQHAAQADIAYNAVIHLVRHG